MIKGRVAPAAGALIASVCLAYAGSAAAYNFDWGDIQVSLDNTFTVGGTLRVESRDPDLISKLNNNPNLCPEDCLDLGGQNGDPAPNQNLVDARGGFVAHLGDNGNLNFDKWDWAAAQARLGNDLTVRWGKVTFQMTALGFYDGINSNLDQFHPDNFEDVPMVDGNAALGVPPTETANQPRHTSLSHSSMTQIGHDYDILEAFVAAPFNVFGKRVTVAVGEQRVHWGEALFNFLGSLDQLNPVDQNRLFFPGTDIASVFEPSGLVVLDTQINADIGLELVYQYDWEPSIPSADGSMFGTVEAAGGADAATLSLGQVSEDRERRGGFTNDVARSATSTTLGIPVGQVEGRPHDGGQYGARLTWYIPNLNGGTELSFYGLNYHARLPAISAYASDKSCTRNADDVPAPGTGSIPGLNDLSAQLEDALNANGLPSPLDNITLANLDAQGAAVAIACGGFNGEGSTAEALQATFGPLSPNGPSEPLPAGTVHAFLDYPEDIHMYGMSFTTNFGKWALAGEYAFRPNQPLAVQGSDVLFAALQPSLPDQDVNILVGTLPSNRHAVPDFVETRYRGNTVQPNERISGYERFKVHTVDFTGLRVFGPNNPLFANQIILAVELGMTYVPHITAPLDLPLESLDMAGESHASPGADGTGQPGGQPDPRSLNPTQQTEHYPDDFSSGYRILTQLQYNDLLFGKTVKSQIAFLHDIYGISPQPIQNYVEDRKQVIMANTIEFSNALSSTLTYQAFFGGQFDNLGDRDNIRLSVAYSF